MPTQTPGPLATATPLPVGHWRLLPDQSSARFTVRNFGLVKVHGTVPFVSGFVQIGSDGALSASGALLDLDRIDTSNARRDLDLHKASLLDLERYPELTCVADSARWTGQGWQLLGWLSAHGATAEVVLTCLTMEQTDDAVNVRATAKIDRREPNIRAPRVLIGHEIAVEVTARFVLDPTSVS